MSTVDLTKRVKVYATAKHPHAKDGEELTVGEILAEKLEKAGWVTKTKKGKE